jgi:uncharacterized protein (DUF2147 family)
MKKIKIILFLVSQVHWANGQTSGKTLSGKWITEEKDIIEFYKRTNVFEGKVIALGDKAIMDKHPQIEGAIVFKKLEQSGEESITGTYYDIESEETYTVSIKFVDSKTIKLKFGTGIFSQTQEFKRIQLSK